MTEKLQPFIQWVGSKRQLIPALMEAAPKQFRNYYEPFLGGGAMFINLLREGKITGHAVLSDISEPLIITFTVVKDSIEDLISETQKPSYDYSSLDVAEHNFNKNKARFNELKMKDTSILSPHERVELACLFIFLNKLSFSSVYRENSHGHYNVPFAKQPSGKCKTKVVFDITLLRLLSTKMNNVNASFHCKSFLAALDDAGPGDLVFLDPPYDGSKVFRGYNKAGFSGNDQLALKTFCDELTERGCYVMITNGLTDNIQAMFATPTDRYQISVHSSKHKIRGGTPKTEMIISNKNAQDYKLLMASRQ